jgi:serine/threonine-protein kinase
MIGWRNLRSGRGDRRGATKLFLLYSGCLAGSALIIAHHAPVLGELDLFWKALSVAALNGGALYIFYVAFEPFVRRHWPQTMISWSRFTTRGFRDPRVGRDILYGAAMGALFAILKLAQLRLHGVAGPPSIPNLSGLEGIRMLAAFGLEAISNALFDPMIALFILFLMRVLLRNQWLAAAASVALLTVIAVGSPVVSAIDIPATVISELIEVLVLLRFGVPAVIAGGIVSTYLLDTPITFDFSSWYADIGVAAIAGSILIAWYGFRVSLAGRPLWRDDAL